MGKKIKAKNIDSEMTTDIELSQAIASKQDTLSFTPENITNKNQPGGYAGLDSNGKVPTSLLPTADSNPVITCQLLNNQTSATNITSIILSNTYSYYRYEYYIFRKTNTIGSTRVQAGQLRFIYNNELNQWFMSDDYLGQNAGIEFSIDSTGQVKYSSTNITGANHIATLKLDLTKRIVY
jgi:hypothetical protein